MALSSNIFRDVIFNIDVKEGISLLSDKSVNCIITSPPYWNMRDYAAEGQIGLESTFEEYVSNLCDLFDDMRRVLRDDGALWVNLGDTYSNSDKGGRSSNLPTKTLCGIPYRFAHKMIDQGWLLRNTIIWHKRSCTPSPVKDRFTVDYELFFFFTKSGKYYFKTQFEPLSESYKKDKRPKGVMRNKFYENSKYAQPYNADGSAMFDETISLDCKPSSEMSEHGRIKRSVWSLKPQPLNVKHFATFPEALIITPMRSCVPERVCAGCGRPFVPIMKPTEGYAKLLGKSWTPEQDASSDDRMNMGFNKTSAKKTACGAQYFFDGYDVKCSCNAGFVPGIALDPFMGSGTVGVVAKKLERSYIGFEINSDYINIATERINSAVYGDITITEEL